MQMESHQGLKIPRRAEMKCLHLNAWDSIIHLDISLVYHVSLGQRWDYHCYEKWVNMFQIHKVNLLSWMNSTPSIPLQSWWWDEGGIEIVRWTEFSKHPNAPNEEHLMKNEMKNNKSEWKRLVQEEIIIKSTRPVEKYYHFISIEIKKQIRLETSSSFLKAKRPWWSQLANICL